MKFLYLLAFLLLALILADSRKHQHKKANRFQAHHQKVISPDHHKSKRFHKKTPIKTAGAIVGNMLTTQNPFYQIGDMAGNYMKGSRNPDIRLVDASGYSDEDRKKDYNTYQYFDDAETKNKKSIVYPMTYSIIYKWYFNPKDSKFQKINLNLKYLIQEIPGLKDLKDLGLDDLKVKVLKVIRRPVPQFGLGESVVGAQHEMLAICVKLGKKVEKFDDSKRSRFFIFDRQATQATGSLDMDTSTRIIYLGHGKTCEDNEPRWPENDVPKKIKLKTYENNENQKAIIKKPEITFNEMIYATENYVLDNPIYEFTGSNCQEYATGLYNMLVDSKLILTTSNTNVTHCVYPPNFNRKKYKTKNSQIAEALKRKRRFRRNY